MTLMGSPQSRVLLPQPYPEGGKWIFSGRNEGLAQLLTRTILAANDKSQIKTGLNKNKGEKKFVNSLN